MLFARHLEGAVSGVLRGDVGALADQHLGGVGLLARIAATHTILTLTFGLTDWAPSMKALMPRRRPPDRRRRCSRWCSTLVILPAIWPMT